MKKDILGLLIAHTVNFSLIEAVLGYAQGSYNLTWVSIGEMVNFSNYATQPKLLV